MLSDFLEDADNSDLADAVDLLRALQDADTAHALNVALGRALAGIHAASATGSCALMAR